MIPYFYDFRMMPCTDGSHSLHFEAMLIGGVTIVGNMTEDEVWEVSLSDTIAVLSRRQEGARGRASSSLQQSMVYSEAVKILEVDMKDALDGLLEENGHEMPGQYL